MEPSASNATGLNKMIWAGRVMTGIVTLFLLFDIVIHLMVIPPVVDSFNQLGLPIDLSIKVGFIELVCLILYLVPRTSIFGAILQTGYLGGAVAIHLRVHAPLFSTALFPVYAGVLLWGGLYLRNDRLRAFLSYREG